MNPGPLKLTSLTIVLLATGLVLSFILQLDVTAPTGAYAVGQRVLRWVDRSRPEVLTEDPNDFREVVALTWYPAEAGTGASSPYFPGLSHVSKALMESGEVDSWEVFGLQFIRSKNQINAEPSKTDAPYPVVILLPGNGTNAEFYTGLASEIASHGYVVVGINHPYDVAAVELSDGNVAGFNKEQWSFEMSEHQAYIAERIEVRTADVLFVLDELEDLNLGSGALSGMLDLESVAVAGHSLGGITASEACKADARFRACLNFDGLLRGGPFSVEQTAIPPDQPFMFMTKESELHPRLVESFESTSRSYWVVIHRASHDSFTDGPLLQPSFLPVPNEADRIMTLVQKYTLAFLQQTLNGQPSELLSESMNKQDVSVEVYPSH